MYKITLFLLFALVYPLLARENPFFPIDSQLDVPLSADQTLKAPRLTRAALTLPSTAREIESISVKYKNLDGSIATKTIQLQNSIDWHIPIFISQNYNLASESEPLKKRAKFKKFASLKFISFYTNKKVMKIQTHDMLIRSFVVPKPQRIVCDFKRDVDMRSFEKKASKESIFKKINIGAHSGYYRVVIELDGIYKYSIDKAKGGYIINLH